MAKINSTMSIKWMLLALFGVAMTLATVYDLTLTEWLYDPMNPIALFLWRFSELPISLVALFSLALVSVEFKTTQLKYHHDIDRVMPLLPLAVGGVMGAQMGSYYDRGQSIWILAGILMGHLMLALVKGLGESNREKFYPLALRIVFVYAGAVIFPNLLKILWGRPRYRIIVSEGMSFSPWYLPKGMTLINDDLKSFPSGHSAVAAVSLMSCYLPRYFESLKGKEKLLLALSVLWTIGIMTSRIVIGHHFLSDTLFGAGITIAMIVISETLFRNLIKPK